MSTRNISEMNQKEINAISGGSTESSINVEKLKKIIGDAWTTINTEFHQVKTLVTENPKQAAIMLGTTVLATLMLVGIFACCCKNKDVQKKIN